MGSSRTEESVLTDVRGYAQAAGVAPSAAAGAWFDAAGQGVLPGLEEHAVSFRLRCRTPEETFLFVLVDGLTFVVPLEEARRLRQLYPRVEGRLWELWAARRFSRELQRACDRELEAVGL